MGTIREQILEASSLDSGTIRELLAEPNTGLGDGDCILSVAMEGPEEVVVSEDPGQSVVLEESDFDVKVVQKETIIIKE